MALSTFFMLLAEVGRGFLENYGVNTNAAVIITNAYAALGVLMCAVNVILLVATFTYNEFYILMYLWFAVAWFTIDSFLVAVISLYAFVNDHLIFALLILAIDWMFWMVLYYQVFPVLNGFRRNIHTVVIVLA